MDQAQQASNELREPVSHRVTRTVKTRERERERDRQTDRERETERAELPQRIVHAQESI